MHGMIFCAHDSSLVFIIKACHVKPQVYIHIVWCLEASILTECVLPISYPPVSVQSLNVYYASFLACLKCLCVCAHTPQPTNRHTHTHTHTQHTEPTAPNPRRSNSMGSLSDPDTYWTTPTAEPQVSHPLVTAALTQ